MRIKGKGIGCMWYPIGFTVAANPSAATVKVNEDGTATLLTGTVETGQGSLTVLGQIAAEELAIQITPGATFETTHGHIPVSSTSRVLLLIEVDTAPLEGGALRPPDRGSIPVAARQEYGSVFFHGMYQYVVPGSKESGDHDSVAS